MNSENDEHKPIGGKAVAWVAFVFGSVVSIAGNVLASRLPPANALPEWQPSVFAQIGAAVWPISLLLAVEVLSRVRWPSGALWKLARYGGVLGVALGSAAISYGHIRAVLLSWNYDPISAGVGPLVLDGLMVVSGFALLANAIATRAETRVPAVVPAVQPDIPAHSGMSLGEGLDPGLSKTVDPQVNGPVIDDDPDPDPQRVPASVPDPNPSGPVPALLPARVNLDPATLGLFDPDPTQETPTPATRVKVVAVPNGHDPDPVPDPDDIKIATQVLTKLAPAGQTKPKRDRFAAELRETGKWRGRNPAAGVLLNYVWKQRELVSA